MNTEILQPAEDRFAPPITRFSIPRSTKCGRIASRAALR
jgi:hypothetical protein